MDDFTREQIGDLRQQLKDVKKDYVSKAEFEVVKAIAYGLASVTLLGVLASILQLVIK